jgi:hypothetical protein
MIGVIRISITTTDSSTALSLAQSTHHDGNDYDVDKDRR